MKVFISVSAWAELPPTDEQTLVTRLPDGFSIVKHPGHWKRNMEYFLLDGNKQAGSAIVLQFGMRDKATYWIDVIYLEPKYRGKNYMRSLLWFVVRDYGVRPMFIDAHQSNINTYRAVGFRPMTAQQLKKYKKTLESRHFTLNYDRPIHTYTPMILEA